jgi:DNA-binding response OmpR family regulator
MGLMTFDSRLCSVYSGDMALILLVDDEPAITESLAYALERTGFETLAAADLAAADRWLSQHVVDLIVLDIVLPDGNGLDWLRGYRANHKTPVIILSSHDETVDHVVGLELGADDYIGKPFSPREVVARVRAVLRRTEMSVLDPVRLQGILIDSEKRQVHIDGVRLNLARIEFELLRMLAEHPGRVYDREQILTRIWGPDVAVTERTVDVHVKSLRKKLVTAGQEADMIETVRGVGYRLADA